MNEGTMNNPVELLETLDSFLDHEVSLVVYGRGALCLGYEQPRAEFLNTQDVDGSFVSSNWMNWSMMNDSGMPWT